MRADGSEKHRWAVQNWSHGTWLDQTDVMQGTLLPPGHAIVSASPNSAPHEVAAAVSGPYYWHSAPSSDGQWIVSDTNWPDIGIQLIHVPTGHFRTLCMSDSGYAHPHPVLNHDASNAMFTSDRSGISQVYCVEISDAFKEEVAAENTLKKDRAADFPD
jgi:hypothetical protein